MGALLATPAGLALGAALGAGMLALCLVALMRPFVGVCAFVFLSAVTIMPSLPVTGDRLILADFVMAFALIGALRAGILTAPAPRGLVLVDQLGLLFAGVLLLSSLAGLALTPNPERVALFTAIYLYGYLCFRLVIRVVDSEARLRAIVLTAAAAAAMVIVIGTLSASGIWKPHWTYDPVIERISATFRKSGQVSSYLGPALFALVALGTMRGIGLGARLASLILLAGGFYVLLWTGSRISFVIMLFVAAVALWAALMAGRPSVRAAPLAALALVGAGAFGAFSYSVTADTQTRYGLTTTAPVERALRIFSETARDEQAEAGDWAGSRAIEISEALRRFPEHPLLGIGSGMFGQTYRLNEIHNSYVSILAENGLFTLIAFGAWWASILALLWRAIGTAGGPRERYVCRLLLGAFGAIAIYQMTTNGMRQRPFWIVPAIAAAGAATLARPYGARQVAMGPVPSGAPA